MTIKEKIKQEIIERASFKDGLQKLRLVSKNDFDALHTQAQLSNYEHGYNTNILYFDQADTAYNKIQRSAIYIIDQLPDDEVEMLKCYLNYLLKNDLDRAWKLLLQCRVDANHLQSEVENYDDFDQIYKFLIYREIENGLPKLSADWRNRLWENLSYTPSFSNAIISSEDQPKNAYLHSILKRKEKDNKFKFDSFLVWSEQYAAKDYEDAYQTALFLRRQYPAVYPSYEYLFISYAYKCRNQVGFAESNTWFLYDSDIYKKLVVYVEYAQELCRDLDTLPDSKEMVRNLLLSELEKLYDKTSYDYVVRNATRSSSQKKDIIIKIINSCCRIENDFGIKNKHQLFEKLLVELLGGAKFRWMDFEEHIPTNNSDFDAKTVFETWKSIIDETDPIAISRVCDGLKGNIGYKISSLSIVRNKSTKQRELYNVCCLANYFFPEGGFLDIASTIAKEERGITQQGQQQINIEKSILFSEKPEFEFAERKNSELLSEERNVNQTKRTDESQIPIYALEEKINIEDEDKNVNAENENKINNAITQKLVLEPIGEAYFTQVDIEQDSAATRSEHISTQFSNQEAKTIEGNFVRRDVSLKKYLFKLKYDIYIKLSVFVLGCSAIFYNQRDTIQVFICTFFLFIVIISSLVKSEG